MNDEQSRLLAELHFSLTDPSNPNGLAHQFQAQRAELALLRERVSKIEVKLSVAGAFLAGLGMLAGALAGAWGKIVGKS